MSASHDANPRCARCSSSGRSPATRPGGRPVRSHQVGARKARPRSPPSGIRHRHAYRASREHDRPPRWSLDLINQCSHPRRLAMTPEQRPGQLDGQDPRSGFVGRRQAGPYGRSCALGRARPVLDGEFLARLGILGRWRLPSQVAVSRSGASPRSVRTRGGFLGRALNAQRTDDDGGRWRRRPWRS